MVSYIAGKWSRLLMINVVCFWLSAAASGGKLTEEGRKGAFDSDVGPGNHGNLDVEHGNHGSNLGVGHGNHGNLDVGHGNHGSNLGVGPGNHGNLDVEHGNHGNLGVEDGNHGNSAALIEDHECHLHPYDPLSRGSIARHQRPGHLLLVTLQLWQGHHQQEPEMGEFYVTRPGDNLGRMALSLVQSLPALSRLALPFLTEELTLGVVDSPHGCIRHSNVSTRARAARHVMLEDFAVHQSKDEGCTEREHSVCRVSSIENPGWWEYPRFEIECCRMEGNMEHACVKEEGSKLLTWMRCLLCLAKLVLYLVAPALIARLFSTHSELLTSEVLLARPISKTVLVKSTKVPHVPREEGREGREGKEEPFSRLRDSIKSVVTGRILNMSINKVCVSADRSGLVGVSSFASDILRCCNHGNRAGIHGNGGEEGGGGCCRVSLGTLLSVTAGLLLLSAPLYLRITALYHLHTHLDHTSVTMTTDYHGSWVWLVLAGVHATFVLTLLLLLLAYRADAGLCDVIMLSAYRDLRVVSRRSVARMMYTNLKLPFKKLGRYGVVVAVLYWIFSLPLCFLTAVIYSVPSVYIFGRFLLHARPRLLRRKMTVLSSRESEMTACCCRTSAGTTLERYLRLGEISPGKAGPRLGFLRGILGLVLGLVAGANLASLLVILGEILTLCGEALLYLTFYMFAHADRMLSYIVLLPGVAVYVCLLYRAERDFYTGYKSQLFSVLDSLVEEVVREYTTQGGYEGASLGALGERNTAFYLPEAVLRERLGEERAGGPGEQFVGRVDQKLYWCTSGVVYWIAGDRTRYVSGGLLERVGSLRGPGYNPRGHVTRRLGYLLLMLAYLSLASLILAYVTELDGERGASHVLLTLAYYGLPLVAFHTAGSRRPHVDLLSLRQAICRAGQSHHERWLVCDLAFPAPRLQSPSPPEGAPEQDAPDGGATNNYSSEDAEQRPSYVDFVFCVGVDEEERTEERHHTTDCNREEFVMLPV